MNCFFLDKVALNPLSSITLWRFPGESASPPCHITDLQVSRSSWQVYRPTNEEIQWISQKDDKMDVLSFLISRACCKTIPVIKLYIPSTVTLTLTTLCPAGLSALMMYRPLWLSLLMGMVTTEVVSEEWIWKETCEERVSLWHVHSSKQNGLTSESTGRTWRSFFFSVSAVPSKVQVTLGRGRPVIVAGILMVVSALQFIRS